MERIGIIGEGKMGTNIFQYLSGFGYSLTWIVSNDADIVTIENNFRKKLKRSASNGIISSDEYEKKISSTVITNSLEAVSECDLIIEAVSENLSLKKAIFRELDIYAGKDCILATNSSSILPSELVPSEERKDKTIGLHFFYPVALKNLVEFIRIPDTSLSTTERTERFLGSVGRNFISLMPENAFVMNRIFLLLQREAYSIVLEGIAGISQVDQIVKEHITPSGVFEFCDCVGNDIMLESVINYSRHDPEKDTYLPFLFELGNLVRDGKLGKKTGFGFYNWNNEVTNSDQVPADTAELILKRLKNALGKAVSSFSLRAGIQEEKMKNLLSEYL